MNNYKVLEITDTEHQAEVKDQLFTYQETFTCLSQGQYAPLHFILRALYLECSFA